MASPIMSARLKTYSSFVKLEHTLFSLPLFYAGALLAGKGWPSFRLTLLILLAGAGARVVALALNRIIDRHIDAKNPRTQDRHLSQGSMKVIEAGLVGAVGLVIYLFAAWLISDLCLKLSWVPLIGFTAYPFFKRFTKWTHVGLGIVWSLIPIAGFLAMGWSRNGFASVCVLAVFSIFWLAGFDIIYATLDEEFDRDSKLFSLPACWGAERALKTAGTFHLLAFLALVALYSIWFAGPVTVLFLMLIGVLLYAEYGLSHHVDLAFFKINTIIGFAVLLFVVSGIKGY
jgi:4-hydroxybenzoate polyprenyltransferase